ncbi:MAG: hypothetical protein QW286_02840, partial [Candidatus Aenigmatarchaeota archaeon]
GCFLIRKCLAFAAIFAFLIIQNVGAQTCFDTNPESNPRTGCPDPFYLTIYKPITGADFVELNLTVKNRKILYPPDCNPGEQFCYENKNYQGLPLCYNKGWTGKFTDVKINLLSCDPDCDLEGCPDCDFGLNITPSTQKTIENERSQDFSLRIKTYKAVGFYRFTFGIWASSEKKGVFLLNVNVSEQPRGVGGDNDMCPTCAIDNCELGKGVCEGSCTSAKYCSAPECFFDTPQSFAAEYCCGDDSGEFFKKCAKTTQISWECPQQSACCGDRGECVYSGNCYSYGVHLLKEDEDRYAFCLSGLWHDCDENPSLCSACGFVWKNSACCGDDKNEFYNSRICFSGCQTNRTDRACCNNGGSCVYNGTCYETGEKIQIGKINITCEGGVWEETSPNQTVCYKGACNKKDNCELPCPGCMFKDFSCYGTNCEPDYLDPDMHWTYCWNCSANWSFQNKMCCGDDEKEYWVLPCPNAKGVDGGCCSNPNERIDSNGNCVIFCGTGIMAKTFELDEISAPISISVPDSISAEQGRTSRFTVEVKNKGNITFHNIVPSFCGPFSLRVSPQKIKEILPGQGANFTAEFDVPPDAVPGISGLAVYVEADELLSKRYKPVSLKISIPEFPGPEFLAWVAFSLVLVYIAKKLLSRRKHKPASSQKEVGKGKGPKGKKSREGAINRLAGIIAEEMEAGTSEREIRKALESEGISRDNIRAAFRLAKNKLKSKE